MARPTLVLAVVFTLLVGVFLYSMVFYISRPMAAATSSDVAKPIFVASSPYADSLTKPAEESNLRSAVEFPSVATQLKLLEQSLSEEMVGNFKFQSAMPRSAMLRPHDMPYLDAVSTFPVPVPESCPSSIRPDEFCAPNTGRDWTPSSTVFPISYSLPAELFPNSVPSKDKDCSSIVPRDKGTYNFATEEAYIAEYARSYYCISYKKGGWDVLRHYEIIAAGCMPYLPDIESCPVYTLYHLPKKLLLEARDLPGVHFNCSAVRVTIDHTVFPRRRYFELLSQLLEHSRNFLTTEAMAQYVLNVTQMRHAKKILYFSAAKKGVMLKAQGNYNSWTLFHGLRTLLGAGVVDPFPIPFLYRQPKSIISLEKRQLYGFGFGYAYKLPNIDVDRSNLVDRIKRHEFDLIIFGDPTAMSSASSHGRSASAASSSRRTLKYLSLVKSANYTKKEIIFLHAPDIAYPAPSTIGYDISALYDEGIVFQREIMDCAFYAPTIRDGQSSVTKGEAMKRCVWYHNKNCLDDVNVLLTLQRKGLSSYPWSWPAVKRNSNAA